MLLNFKISPIDESSMFSELFMTFIRVAGSVHFKKTLSRLDAFDTYDMRQLACYRAIVTL